MGVRTLLVLLVQKVGQILTLRAAFTGDFGEAERMLTYADVC
jgi:hypothetical protein